MKNTQFLAVLVGVASVVSGQTIVTGLQAPQKMVLTPRGNFLVSETSTSPNAGRVSFVSRSGARRTFLDALPSGAAAPGDGSGPTGLALRERTLYMAIGTGDGERNGTAAGTSIYNPAGESSPIFSSILMLRFNADVDTVQGPFTFTPQIQQRLADGLTVTIQDGAGSSADVSVLADFPDASPDPVSVYRFSDPWGIDVSADGQTLYVADASSDAVTTVDTTTGRWRRIAHFGKIPNSTPVGPPVSDAVPTAVRPYGNQLLVSFLTGFPFVPGAARVLLLEADGSASQPFIWGLNSATDVAWRARAGQRPQFFVLEHSVNQLATPEAPGRLLRYDTALPVVMSDTLSGPVSLAIDADTNTVFVLELAGRIVGFPLP